MSARILKGKPVADAISAKIKAQTEMLAKQGIYPKLAIVRVGEKPDDMAYERSAKRRCELVGMACKSIVIPATADENELIARINELNGDKTVHGVLLLRPLPKNMDEHCVIESLLPEKDVDGITCAAMAGLYSGSGVGFAPCTARACMEILGYYGIETEGKRAVVLGRSTVIGKPAAMLLLSQNATVTICHTRTKNAPELCRGADIVIAAVGRSKTVTGDYLSGLQTVIDVGINVDEDGNMTGDVDIDSALDMAGAVTPVPGGVGSVTTAVLCLQTLEAAKRQEGARLE